MMNCIVRLRLRPACILRNQAIHQIEDDFLRNEWDGLIAQYAGGPQPQPNYAVHHGTLYASGDPVALDAIALKRLEEWRKRGSLRPVGSVAAYIDFASQLGLGNSATNRIEVRNIGR